MKSMIVRKIGFAILLIVTLLTSAPAVSVHAETSPNTTVSDFYDKDSGEEVEVEMNSEEPAADRTEDGAAVRLSAWDYIKTFFALLFVVGLLFAVLKFMNRKNRMYDKTRLMKNLGGLSLGQQKSIQLVVVGESYYLIGVGEDIRLLKEITDPQEIESLLSFYEDGPTVATTGLLQSLLDKVTGRKKTHDHENSAEMEMDFSDQFKARLEEMKEERKRQIRRLTEKERHPDE
ncbi:flagellar biosynthetic protein FliO [Sporosarcina sp. 179-K 3D1 HS]|uniref:flagellar biosynthetic protein FliO n=1 Tax=Sporosarcina sp. 179-K 3D1 HS TaxID=3232169 RepID=UPI00399F1A27